MFLHGGETFGQPGHTGGAALRDLGFDEIRALRNLELPRMAASIDEFTGGERSA